MRLDEVELEQERGMSGNNGDKRPHITQVHKCNIEFWCVQQAPPSMLDTEATQDLTLICVSASFSHLIILSASYI